jgi:hypothetical protein
VNLRILQIEKGKGENTVEIGRSFNAILRQVIQQCFGIGMTFPTHTGELLAKIEVVVYFSIENKGVVAAWSQYGLLSSWAKILNCQSGMSEVDLSLRTTQGYQSV